MQPEPKSQAMDNAAYLLLWASVTTSDTGHDPGSVFGAKPVGHTNM
jgi:hypothetical protein